MLLHMFAPYDVPTLLYTPAWCMHGMLQRQENVEQFQQATLQCSRSLLDDGLWMSTAALQQYDRYALWTPTYTPTRHLGMHSQKALPLTHGFHKWNRLCRCITYGMMQGRGHKASCTSIDEPPTLAAKQACQVILTGSGKLGHIC